MKYLKAQERRDWWDGGIPIDIHKVTETSGTNIFWPHMIFVGLGQGNFRCPFLIYFLRNLGGPEDIIAIHPVVNPDKLFHLNRMSIDATIPRDCVSFAGNRCSIIARQITKSGSLLTLTTSKLSFETLQSNATIRPSSSRNSLNGNTIVASWICTLRKVQGGRYPKVMMLSRSRLKVFLDANDVRIYRCP